MKISWLMLLLIIVPLFCLGQKFRAKNMGVEKGLSESTVRAIIQGRDGFIWLGTRDGLNRYDGYKFDVFRYKPDQPNGLGGNFVGSLYQDQSGAIWAGDMDRGGVSRFDPATHTFSQIKDSQGKRLDIPMAEITEDAKGNIWLGTLRGVFLVKNALREDGKVDSLQVELFEPARKWGPINNLIPDSEGGIWVTSSITRKTGINHQGGIGRIDLGSLEMDTSLWNPQGKGLLPDNQVNSLLEDEEGKLWIGLADFGLYVSDKPKERPFEARKIPYSRKVKRKLGDRFIHVLEKDSKGNIWVGTHHGLLILPYGKRDSLYEVQLTNLSEFPLEEIWAITEDDFGNIWIGASDGCYQLLPLPSDFAHHYHVPQNPQSLISNDVLTLLERKNGEIWVGTGDKGITRMVPTEEGFSYTHYNQENGLLSSNVVLGFTEDSKGQVISTSFAGLFIFTFESQAPGAKASIRNIRHEAGNPNSLGSDYVYNTIEEDGAIWVSDYIAGPSLIKITKDGILRESFGIKKGDLFSLQTGYSTEISMDLEGNIWQLGKRGLSLMYREEGKFVGYRHIFNENLTKNMGLPAAPLSFYQDKEGILWVGANGLNKITLGEGWRNKPGEEGVPHELPFEITYYGKDEGLVNEVIYFIQPDKNGILWLGTSGGLVRFDPVQESFKTYTKEDGFQDNEFSGDASFLGKDGLLYVGGINGFNIFNPDSLLENEAQPRAIIRSLQLFGEEVLPGRKLKNSRFILPQAIQQISGLELSYKDKVIGFELGTDNFTASEKQLYQYRIAELQDGWISLNEQRSLTLTNLSPGNYKLEFRCSNPDGVWSTNIRSLDLSISPPWWQEGWFYLLILVVTAALIYLFVRLRIREVRREMRIQARLNQAKIEEREQTRAETSRDFHDEAGNRITKIGLYANLLRETVGEESEPLSFIEKIEDHTRELSARMRDFIWVLDPNQDELAASLTRIRDFGVNLFEHTDIEFETGGNWRSIPKVRLEVKAKRHLLMIAKEAFHNALKYSNCSHLRMDLGFQGEKMRWQIVDDGMGFNLEEASQGMGLRNMRLRAEELDANFEIQSQPGMGTKIILDLDLQEKE